MKPLRTVVIPLLSLLLAVLLAGCSQGNTASTDSNSSQQQSAQQTIALAAAVTGAAGIVIDNYLLVSSTRIDRTVYEYTYKADVSNWGSGDATITATLASNAAQITVVEGALSFGEVIEGATKESTDTFTIRHDRSQPFSEDALVWTVQATPLLPTTFELIDTALANGVIDAETALVYKVFYEFHDDRLPAQYVGRDDGSREATAIHTAIESFSTLSPQTQEILTPFLLPPNDPASWYQQQLAQPAVQPANVAAVVATTTSSIPAPATVVGGEVVTRDENGLPVSMRIRITRDNGTILVYWDDRRLEDAGTAYEIADAIDLTIWPKLTALFGEPPLGTAATLEVHLVNTQTMTVLYGEDATGVLGLAINACHSGIPVVYLNRDQKKHIVQTAAHEITHAILAKYQRNCDETFWLGEATATWAEHYTYPNVNTEQDYAPHFLNNTTVSLETKTGKHEYGAYLWFLFITEGDATGTSNAKTQRVLATWNALATHDSLGAVDAAVSDIGGLKKQWPKFALYNWNRVATSRTSGNPYVYYGNWDGLTHKARESAPGPASSEQQPPKKVTLDGKAYDGYGLPHRINHLGAEYWHFDFRDDNNIRRVRLWHPYANGSQPTAKVQVIAKIRNQGWKTVEVDEKDDWNGDWTGFERKTLCRDKPKEDFEELVVVISNSEFTNRNHVLDQTVANEAFIEVSALGCSNWKGSVIFSAKSGASDDIILSESGVASNVTLEILEDGFVGQSFSLTGGDVSWEHSGSYNRGSDICAGSSRGGYSLVGSLMGLEWFNAFAPWGTTEPIPVYIMFGTKYLGVTPPDDYVCSSNPPSTDSPIYGTHYVWLDMHERVISGNSPGLYDSDPTGNVLQGSSIIVEQNAGGKMYTKTRTYTWTFEKNGTFDGEPLP